MRERRAKKKVTIVANNLRWFGGGERWVLEVSSRLRKRFDITILNPASGSEEEWENARKKLPRSYALNGVHVEDITCRSIGVGVSEMSFRMMIPGMKGIKAIGRIVEGSDIVYQMGMNPFVLLCSLLYAKRMGKRYIIGMHNPLLMRERPYGGALERLSVWLSAAIQMPLLRYIGEVHVQTETQEKSLLSHGYRGRFYYIRHFLYTPKRGKRERRRLDRFRVLFVGRLTSHQKGLDMLEKIAGMVLRNNSHIEMHVVGNGEDSEIIKRLVKRHKGRIVWRGFVNDNELLKEYKSADLFIFPSRYETPGLTLLEAQRYGLPAVAFRVQGPVDIMKKGFQGRLIRPFDTEAFARAVIEYSRLHAEKRQAYIKMKCRISKEIEGRYSEALFMRDFSSMLNRQH